MIDAKTARRKSDEYFKGFRYNYYMKKIYKEIEKNIYWAISKSYGYATFGEIDLSSEGPIRKFYNLHIEDIAKELTKKGYDVNLSEGSIFSSIRISWKEED